MAEASAYAEIQMWSVPRRVRGGHVCASLLWILLGTSPAGSAPPYGEIENILNSCEIDVSSFGDLYASFIQGPTLQLRFDHPTFPQTVLIPIREVEVSGGAGIEFACIRPGCITIESRAPAGASWIQPRTIRRSDYLFPWCEREDFRQRAVELLRLLRREQ